MPAPNSPPLSRSRRPAYAVVFAFAVLAGLFGFGASPSQANEVSCWGDWCSGLDPETTGCAEDAETTAWTDIQGGRLELRWSPTCKTNWARYHQYERGWYFGNVPTSLRAVQDPTGFTVNGAADNETYWTPMIYTPNRWVQAELWVQCTGIGDCLQKGLLTGELVIRTEWA